jgi:hypothetical protein
MEDTHMTRWIVAVSIFALGVVSLGGVFSPAAAADVRIGVNIGVPTPVVVAPAAPVFVARPAPVVVAPPVFVAPGVPVYYYGSSYYTYYNRAWFVGPGYGGPWNFVPVARVPRAIIAVPHAYLRVPPGHAHHFAGPPPWPHGHGHGRDWHHR